MPTSDKPIRASVFRTMEQADEVVQKLLAAGFSKDQISVVCSDESKEQYFHNFEHERPAGSYAPGAVAAGAAMGGVVGGLTTAGLATAAGISVLVAGPSFLIGGAVAGGLIGLMTTRGVERELADFYDQAVTRGRILVAAEDHSEKNAERLAVAERIFREAGAEPMPLSEG